MTTITEEQKLANNLLLDWMRETLGLKNDAALSRALCQAPPVVSKIRHGRLLIGDGLVITCHELTGLPVREIKAQLGRTSLPVRDVKARYVKPILKESQI